ncbi:hypothetical protein ACFPME_07310 [Rhodanobacter umsongensis]|uniref:Fap system outer membrane protein n=1 Tax=Rhodanobacter umsongensis TaxID=633153 RepID=A0ABW0JK65_9GAMM
MKHPRLYLLSSIALALGHWGAPAVAGTVPATNGLQEISDAEMGDMRGRYTVGDNAVAWFGVKMISTWQTPTGQVLQGTLALSMDFTHGGAKPQIGFEPIVSITRADAPLPPPADVATPPVRHVDAAGLANVGGVVQSVQVAGDGNLASNVTQLTISNGGGPPASTSAGTSSGVASAFSGGSRAVATFDGSSASLLLSIDGQGSVEQWIRNGSIGQSVQLTADNQLINNRMEIELVRQTVAANTQLAQNVAQAINQAQGIGLH